MGSFYGRHETMKIAACFVISTCLLIVSLALAQESGLSINAVRVIKSDSYFVEVEVDCNNESKEIMLLSGFAKSRDGLVRSYGYRPGYVPVGQHVKVVMAVTRPPGSTKQASDILILARCNGTEEPLPVPTVA